MSPLYILSLGLLLLHVPHWCPSSAAASDTLTSGQSLAVGGSKLVSRNGKFALGFFQPAAGTISKSQNTSGSSWYLGIWFNKIPVFTVVWVASRDQPITGPSLSRTKLQISSDGNLVIVDNDSVLWSTHIVNNRTQARGINTTASAAVLLNSGNLALTVTESPSSLDLPLWQSFDHPIDIVLPGAKFGRNKITGLNRKGVSKKSLIDQGLGSYSVELDTSGQVVLKRINPSVMYWHWASSKTSSLKLIPILKSILDIDPRTKGLINPAYVDNDTSGKRTFGRDPLVPACLWAGTKGPATSPQFSMPPSRL
uniref:non-specific serine/threonine protein kinase n=1 Tax=Hordeum vulgare subsp. vulgare TaxID=112509 RepID=F2CQW3_HORVV|nr:predicted protein [Hordeum vulgare subsp. vulgare]